MMYIGVADFQDVMLWIGKSESLIAGTMDVLIGNCEEMLNNL